MNRFDEINNIVRAVNKERCCDAIPVVLLRVDLQEISCDHVHRSRGRILNGAHIGKRRLARRIAGTQIIHRLVDVREEGVLVLIKTPGMCNKFN